VKLFKVCILRCISTLGSRVDDQEIFIPELGKIDLLAFERSDFKIMKLDP